MSLVKIFSREYSVQYTEVSIRSLGPEVRRFIPSLVLTQTYLPEQANEVCYADDEEWKNFLFLLGAKYQKNLLLKSFFKLFHSYGREYIKISGFIGRQKLEKLSNADLVKHYKNYQKAIIKYSAFLWMGFLLNNLYSERVKNLLLTKNVNNVDELLPALFLPIKSCGILQLQDDLLKIKKVSKVLSSTKIKSLLTKYKWIGCLDVHNDPWVAQDIINFYKNLQINLKPKLSFAQALKRVNLNKKEKVFVRLVHELVYVKDMRDEYRRKAVYNILPLFVEISSRLFLNRKELSFFSSEEIIDGLLKKQTLTKKEAVQRKDGFLIYLHKDKIVVMSDKNEIKKFIANNVVKENKNENLRGTVASKGHIRGKVKIVLGVKDLSKVEKGDIMVAITTHPDFVPAMNLSAGVVTDEGGLTSHAAIVSRELGIPCIVGTKVATKILKDGDLVEMDANKGIIKKI